MSSDAITPEPNDTISNKGIMISTIIARRTVIMTTIIVIIANISRKNFNDLIKVINTGTNRIKSTTSINKNTDDYEPL